MSIKGIDNKWLLGRRLIQAAQRYLRRQRVIPPYEPPIETPDGYKIAARVLPARPLRYKEAVIMAHGAFCNSDVWRLGLGEDNFVKRLKEEGFEVIIFDNRGHGRSQTRSLTRYDNFDVMVSDVPVVCDWALKTINLTQELGFRKIHWIGHSLGAMMFYAYMATHPEDAKKFASFVSIAGPARIRSDIQIIQLLLKSGALYNRLFQKMGISKFNPIRIVMEGILPFAKKMPEGVFATLFVLAGKLGLDNIPPDLTLKFLADAIEPLPIGLLNSLSANVATGKFSSADGTIDYFKPLGKVVLNALFVAGAKDALVSKDDVREVYKLWGSEIPKGEAQINKKFLLAKNSGHIGVLFDPLVQKRIIRFIVENSTRIKYSAGENITPPKANK